jgi:hypothetical protein
VNSSYKLDQIQAEGPPLVVYPRVRIKYIRSHRPYWRPFLHFQPEGAKCRGDRTTYREIKCTYNLIIYSITDLIWKQTDDVKLD